MRLTLFCLALSVYCSLAPAQGYLTPQDLGLPLKGPLPANLLTGRFNDDALVDVARLSGNTLEIFYFQDQGYPCRPQQRKVFDQPIKSLSREGDFWSNEDNIKITLQDGAVQIVRKQGGLLDLGMPQGFLPVSGKATPPRRLNSFDFQPVWESESHSVGMDFTAAGDLDNDGINELVTWWKESAYADTAYMLIYKCNGDNQYELFMQEPIDFYPDVYNNPWVTWLAIDDVDQDGQKELIFTQQRCFFWEFSAPGVYYSYHSDFTFTRPVTTLAVTDINHNGIKEITQLGWSMWVEPSQSLMVEEFALKFPPNNEFWFQSVAFQEWDSPSYKYWGCFSAGDFDNDDTAEIVMGYQWGISSWQDSRVRYFRYTPNWPGLTEHWMEPNIWATCYRPLIIDLDADGQKELYAAGFGGYSLASNGSGSAYLWKNTVQDSGRIVWWDTTSMPYTPDVATFAIIDSIPCILQNNVIWMSGQFFLFGFMNNQFQLLWESNITENKYSGMPISILDMDHDGKLDFVTSQRTANVPLPTQVIDWEQTALGIGLNPAPQIPHTFTLHPPSPNPFNGSTQISFDLPVLTEVEISIFDINGRMILDRKQHDLAPGRHDFTWRADPRLASGVYLITINAAEAHRTQKAVLLK